MPVDFIYLDIGIGAMHFVIGSATVDLGVKGAADCPAVATMPWRTPSTSGRYCLQLSSACADDANPLNNLGQANLKIGTAHPPAEFTFVLPNEQAVRRDLRPENRWEVHPVIDGCTGSGGEGRAPILH